MKPRGFAGMDPAKQKEIASKGGKAAHIKGTAHEFTPETARAAGKKGGHATAKRKHYPTMGTLPQENDMRRRFPDPRTPEEATA